MSDSTSRRFPSFLQRPLVRRSLITLVILFLLYCLLGFLALPALLKSQAARVSQEQLQRELRIEKVAFNPFTLLLKIDGLQWMEAGSQEQFAAFDNLTVNLSGASLWRLAPVVQEVHLDKPQLRLLRKPDGGWNFDDLLALSGSGAESSEPARFSVNNIQIAQGRVEFHDQQAGSEHVVSDLRVGVPFISSLPADVEIHVEPMLSAMVNDTPLHLQGRALPFADAREAVLDVKLDDLDVTRFLGYLPLQQGVKIPAAHLMADLKIQFRQPKDQAPALLLGGVAALKGLRIEDGAGKLLLGFKELALNLNQMPVLEMPLRVEKISLDELQAELVRGADGSINLEQILATAQDKPKPVPAEAAAVEPATVEPAAVEPAAPASGNGFGLVVDAVAIRAAALRFDDRHSAQHLQAELAKFDLDLKQVTLALAQNSLRIEEVVSDSADIGVRLQALAAKPASARPAAKPATAGKPEGAAMVVEVGRLALQNWSAKLQDHSHAQPVRLQIAPLKLVLDDFSTAAGAKFGVDLQTGINGKGQLAGKGKLGIMPLHGDLQATLKAIDLLPFQPLVADHINLELTRANFSGSGRLLLDAAKDGQVKGGFKGNLTLADMASKDKLGGNDFLRWKALSVTGMDMQLAPFGLAIDDVTLSDFFARIIIAADGRINLQDIVRSEDGAAPPPATAQEQTAAASSPAAADAKVPAAASAATAMPPIAIKKLNLKDGRVRFTDNFIKPNYTANLETFGGTVSGLSSNPESSAKVDLKGQVNHAPLAVNGSINPLRGDLLLDLKASVKGMELPSLSAYSGRYVGYGIDKGKMSFDVEYKIEDRKLTAANRLVLDQLTFGQKVDSPDAMNLPVQLAVALLRDRNGVIDLDLPIGGSIDDPQFSIGGLIVKVIVNLVVKAVTQPFALLGSLFGGGADLGHIEFAAGRAALDEKGQDVLGKLAKALTERPGLKLEISGRADPDSDRAGLVALAIERKLRAQKLKSEGRSAGPGQSVSISKEEYPQLLEQVYRAEKFDKPRNAVGLTKTLPVEEMEKLLREHTVISDDDLLALANRRVQAARDWLLESGQIEGERIFVVASKVGGAAAAAPAPVAAGADASDSAGVQDAGAKDQPPRRVEFSLR